MKSDSELLREYAAGGSDEAFEEIVRRHMNSVYRACLRILKDEAAAEDASQATFIVLMRRARKLGPNVILAGWLVQTAGFCARDAIKSNYRRQKRERVPRPETGIAEGETELLREEINQYLDKALHTLPAAQRECIVLRFLCGRTEESVAEELQCARSTVSTRIAAGLSKLRERLATQGVAVPSVVLGAYLKDQGRLIAPEILPTIVTSIAAGKHVPPGQIMALADGVVAGYQKTRVVAWSAAAVVLLAIAGVIIAAMLRAPAAPAPVVAARAASPAISVLNAKKSEDLEPVAEAPLLAEVQPMEAEVPPIEIEPERTEIAEAPLVAVPQPAKPQPVNFAELLSNTWVRLNQETVQPADAEAGEWTTLAQVKLVYDGAGKRVLFYDRWSDKKSGGRLHYANCLFAYDAAVNQIAPIAIDHWTSIAATSRTIALPENESSPTPCSRRAFHAFTWVPASKSVFLCNGANGTATAGDKVLGHDLCQNTWQFDCATNRWRELKTQKHPRNFPLGASMEYCPLSDSIVYCNGGDLWMLKLSDGIWREASVNVPTGGAGQTVVYDPVRKRMLIAGGAHVDLSAAPTPKTQNDPGFRKLYAFDPITEKITELTDSPTPLYMAHLAYDSKRDVFVTVTALPHGRKPSGVFCYHPQTNTWSEIKVAQQLPAPNGWFGWLPMCYDAERDCFIALLHRAGKGEFFAFRCAP